MYEAAFVCSHVEAKLLLPGPGIRAGNSCLVKLFHHTDVVNNIQDQGLQLQLQDTGLCTGRHAWISGRQNWLSYTNNKFDHKTGSYRVIYKIQNAH